MNNFSIIVKTKKRTCWKKLIRKHGLKVILKNPTRFLIYDTKSYSKSYIKNLKYKIKKHHESTFKP